MNGDLIPLQSSQTVNPAKAFEALARGNGRGAAPQEESSFPWQRSLAAIRRYKWLMLGIIVIGTLAAHQVTRFVHPAYVTEAKIWISTNGNDGRPGGPIRAAELLQTESWPELLRSFAILDRVSIRVPLFVRQVGGFTPGLFEGAQASEKMRPGLYKLQISANNQYALLGPNSESIEAGVLGDSIGRSIGLRWQPPASALRPGTLLSFSFQSPRSASVWLRDQLGGGIPDGSTLFRLTLGGDNPQLIARTLNVLSEEFVATAAVLKRKNLEETANTLKDQLEYAQRELASAEISLEDFRVKTITQPTESGPVAGGVEATRDPVFSSFFSNKIEQDNLRRDRESLERVLVDLRKDEPVINVLWTIPSVTTQGQNLRAILADYNTSESKLRTLRQVYQEDHPQVKELVAALTRQRTQTIPAAITDLVQQLKSRETELNARIASASTELRAIPQRTIEELRLRRNVQTRENLYLTLKNRYEEARLAEASALPDLSVLDSAVAPQFPSKNTAPRLMLIGIVGSIGLALAVALLLDRLDRRFRYPEQATKDLGLNVLAALPKFKRGMRKKPSLEHAAHVLEAFRTLRLGVGAAIGKDRALTLTITSPGPGDGKTLVSANLALAFAQAGYRTLLIDGDIRRGPMHTIFSVDREPGLVDYLRRSATLSETLRRTSDPDLTLMPSGTRLRQGPEYLASSTLMDLFNEVRASYDVIIVDSPPLGVGIDPFALCMATQNMLMVLRADTTDRVLAQAKLEILDRLPVRVIGAVLNDVQMKGAYRYYSYVDGYGVEQAPEEEIDGSQIGTLARR